MDLWSEISLLHISVLRVLVAPETKPALMVSGWMAQVPHDALALPRVGAEPEDRMVALPKWTGTCSSSSFISFNEENMIHGQVVKHN